MADPRKKALVKSTLNALISIATRQRQINQDFAALSESWKANELDGEFEDTDFNQPNSAVQHLGPDDVAVFKQKVLDQILSDGVMTPDAKTAMAKWAPIK